MANVELVIVVFRAASGADLFLQTLKGFEQESDDLFMLDAVSVSKDAMGRVDIDETQEVEGGRGALMGAASGALLGLLGGPVGALVGMAVGAAAGGVTAEVVDVGIPDEMIEDLEERLKPGMSAFLALIEAPWLERVQAAAQSFAESSTVKFWHHHLGNEAAAKLKAKAKRKPKGKA